MIVPPRPSAWNWRVAVTIAYGAAVVLGTHLPEGHPALTTAIHLAGNDRMAHFLAYFGLGGLVFGLCRAVWRLWPTLGTWVGLTAFGAADELTQPWVGRTAEWLDWTADLAGLAVGLAAATAWNRSYRKTPRQANDGFASHSVCDTY